MPRVLVKTFELLNDCPKWAGIGLNQLADIHIDIYQLAKKLTQEGLPREPEETVAVLRKLFDYCISIECARGNILNYFDDLENGRPIEYND